jgi:tetratricopeptide (TPR) repeat protein
MVQKSISINPGRAGTYSTEAWIHFEMGDKEKAIQFQNKAIELYPHPSYIADLEKFKAE